MRNRVLLVLVALLLACSRAQNTTNPPAPTPSVVNGEPLIPFDQGGVYAMDDLQKWPAENYGIIKGLARNNAGTIVYAAMANKVIRIDLTQPWGVSSSQLEAVFETAFAAALIAIEYDESINKVYALATLPDNYIIILDGYLSLQLFPIVDFLGTTLAIESGRMPVPGMNGIHSFNLFPGGQVAVVDKSTLQFCHFSIS